MLRSLQPILKEFLRLHKAAFDQANLDLLIHSHPDPFSVSNMTDTLDGLGIPNMALELEFEQLQALPLPVLSVMTLNGHEQFILVRSLDRDSVSLINESLQEFSMPAIDFMKYWYKTIIAIEPTLTEDLYDNIYFKGQGPAWLIALGLIIFTLVQSGSLPIILFNTLSLAGAVLAGIIFLTENGDTTLAGRFCSDNGKINCKAVLSSKGSRLFGKIRLADLSMVYFVSLFLITSVLRTAVTGMMLLFSSCALAIIPFSLYYQWKIAKHWCLLCLLTTTVLLLQFIIAASVPGGLWHWPAPEFLPVVALAGPIILLSATAWSLYKRQFLKMKGMKQFELEALQFKRDFRLFIAMYEKQPFLPFLDFHSPVAYGNPQGIVQIIAVTNPFCQPCAEVHKILNALMDKLGENVFIQYSFYFNPDDKEDERGAAARYLTERCLSATGDPDRRGILDDWHTTHTIPTTYQPARGPARLVHAALQQYVRFKNDNDIRITPTIILNGKRFHGSYHPDCLPWILPYLTDFLQETTMAAKAPLL